MRRILYIGLVAVALVPAAGASVRLYSGDLAVGDDPSGPARVVDLAAGRVHALYPAGGAFAIGSGFATPTPVRGRAIAQAMERRFATPSSELDAYPPMPFVTSHSLANNDNGSSVVIPISVGREAVVVMVAISSAPS